jgi:hypothetical protein
MKKKITTVAVLSAVMLISLSFKSHMDYHQQNGDIKNYRVYENKSYQILDTVAFYLYSRYQNTDKPKGEALIKKWAYFFSRDAGSPIELLTVDNLMRAFPNNHPFHYAIEAHFRNDQELIGYDNYLKCYKLKYLYNRSLK